ncbi:glycerophosphodiester phosphodiesterase family protein [Chitinophaga sp.]|uniref:glycerophosphodiester phosphodiesterase family protein n=1 Tax=Chitinophaga sp. TaxID=1869181 RepID=UPI002C8AB6F6|nr:glycerophosphodiester phosphodiesterase family protein [Chitinophaga sp.]HWV64836.1 glycerophosphodiester phosphodiesterase family protein [Chitinophaga sp.]
MKQLLLFATLCAGALSVAAQQKEPVDAIINEFYHHPEHIMVAAHRASHNKYPENSLAAVKESIEQGIDVVEIDLHETKDHILVVMHDATITRTTGKPGKIKDYTYRELQQFPLLFNGQPTTEKIPTFEQVLQLTKGRIIVDVDFKEDSESAAKQAFAQIAAHGMEKQVLFFIYDHHQAPTLHSWNPKIPVMPRAHSIAEVAEIQEIAAKQGKFPVIHGDDSFYSDSLMKSITASGTRVWMNALGKYDKLESEKEDAGFDQLRKDAAYANAIQTNYPEKLLVYLRKKGLHK